MNDKHECVISYCTFKGQKLKIKKCLIGEGILKKI